jgi:hypothetical protein
MKIIPLFALLLLIVGGCQTRADVSILRQCGHLRHNSPEYQACDARLRPALEAADRRRPLLDRYPLCTFDCDYVDRAIGQFQFNSDVSRFRTLGRI